MNKKILLVLMLGIVLISFASATIQTLGTFQQGEDVNLIQTCASCTYNNITSILSPNSSELIGNFEMTQTGSVYNFTLDGGNTTRLGEYIVNGLGDIDGTDTVWNYNFFITPTGQTLDNSQSLLILGLIVILILVTCAFLFAGYKIEYRPTKIFLIAMGVLFLMVTTGVAVSMIKELILVGSTFSGIFVNIYRLMLILVSAGGIGLILYIIVMSLRQFYAYRGLVGE